jgi:hypothetical protein
VSDPRYRVFLSHSGKDKVFVKELNRRLTRDGVACFFQDLGQKEEARELLRKAYRAYLDRFGPDHRRTKIIKRNLESWGESNPASSESKSFRMVSSDMI